MSSTEVFERIDALVEDPKGATPLEPPKPPKKEPTDFALGHNPEQVESKYLLLVSRAQAFGMDVTLFAVDSFDPLYLEQPGGDKNIMGYRGLNADGETIVQFPPNFQYLLVNRSAYRAIYDDPFSARPVEAVKPNPAYL